MDTFKTLAMRRAYHSENLLVAVDYVFIAARPPEIAMERTPLDPPHSFLKRLWWNLFGQKCIEKRTEKEVGPRTRSVPSRVAPRAC